MSGDAVFVHFYMGPDDIPSSVGPDGLPVYPIVLRVKRSKPPLTSVDRPATDEDIAESPDAYKMFKNETQGREMSGEEGYPLSMWAALSPSELTECWHHGVFTVEQLAKTPQANMPPAIVELAKRAKRMIELSAKHGKYEAIISELEGQLAAMKEHNTELRALNEAMKVRLDILQARGIAA
jgi:hypothetical protein